MRDRQLALRLWCKHTSQSDTAATATCIIATDHSVCCLLSAIQHCCKQCAGDGGSGSDDAYMSDEGISYEDLLDGSEVEAMQAPLGQLFKHLKILMVFCCSIVHYMLICYCRLQVQHRQAWTLMSEGLHQMLHQV